MKVKKSTIIRSALLILALINQVLSSLGKSVIPISDNQIESLVSASITVILAIRSWWKNNSFTKKAIIADEIKKSM